jgi:hypothetical protein
MMKHGLEEEIKMFRQLAERGLNLVRDKDSSTLQWLREMHDLYTFFEREYPALLERWAHERKKYQEIQVS